jgi:hypothetical protein
MAKVWTDAQKLAPLDAPVQAFADPGAVFSTLAYSQMNAAQWTRNNPTDTSLLDLGAMYLMLHMFTVGSRSGGYGGPTSNEKVGDVSRTMEVMIEDPAWDSTPYGRMFKQLLRTINIESRWLVSGGTTNLPPLPFSGRFIP